MKNKAMKIHSPVTSIRKESESHAFTIVGASDKYDGRDIHSPLHKRRGGKGHSTRRFTSFSSTPPTYSVNRKLDREQEHGYGSIIQQSIQGITYLKIARFQAKTNKIASIFGLSGLLFRQNFFYRIERFLMSKPLFLVLNTPKNDKEALG